MSDESSEASAASALSEMSEAPEAPEEYDVVVNEIRQKLRHSPDMTLENFVDNYMLTLMQTMREEYMSMYAALTDDDEDGDDDDEDEDGDEDGEDGGVSPDVLQQADATVKFVSQFLDYLLVSQGLRTKDGNFTEKASDEVRVLFQQTVDVVGAWFQTFTAAQENIQEEENDE